MPKLKKSACAAIRSATRHARGSSIIVPISYGTRLSADSSAASTAATIDSRTRASSVSYATSGSMISTLVPSSAPTSRTASTIAFACIS